MVEFTFITLTNGDFVVVDENMFDFLNQWKWYFDKSTGYVRTHINNKSTYMHRLVNKTPRRFQTDHVNRNKLDNRKENLRTVTSIQNLRNTGIRITNKSGYKGIWWWKERKKWQVYININYKRIYLGMFKKIEDAIKVRKNAEKLYWNI